jgi:hypothetical protein
MTNDITASISAAAADAQAVAARAKLVKAGTVALDSFATSMQEAVRAYLAEEQPALSPQQFHAQQNAQRMQFYRERKAQGHTSPRVSPLDHAHIFGTILDTVDAGIKPAVKPMLREYAAQQGYAPEWVSSAATKTQPKKMARSLAANRQHPVIQDLKDGHMFTQTHQSALKNATYSGLAELLFSGSQSTRERNDMSARLAALEAQMAQVQAEAARANARLNLMDAGLDWKEQARAILAAEPGISMRALALRVGKSEGALRKYKGDLVQHGSGYAKA